eukprot:TRINITY_DN52015_c0_g1_i1.p1 TRINITY_DN52015_c0_g1~~TRINITY_DN52015_c0_g1_i1.p1  ORF type:complete len:502 (+),score=97.28 TRINITY_DN52015_c0_g1_i1:85-1590(+)
MASLLEDLRAQEAAVAAELARKRVRTVELDSEIVAAKERRQVRQRITELKETIEQQENDIFDKQWEIHAIDTSDSLEKGAKLQRSIHKPLPSSWKSKWDACVTKCEYTWEIVGMSWLENALIQNSQGFAESSCFKCGEEIFKLVYNPRCSKIEDSSRRASLAIRCLNEVDGLFCRYKLFIQRNDGEYVQWGGDGEMFTEDDMADEVFGPDARIDDGEPAAGIFGLSHKELLQSEWVKDDTMKVRCVLQARAWMEAEDSTGDIKEPVEVPPPSITSNFLSLLEDGKWSDVTLKVKGEAMFAHTLVLCTRSEVFERQLHSGMRETVSREVVIEDCEPGIFRAMLRFLYTDDLAHIEGLLAKQEPSFVTSKLGDTGSAAEGSSNPTASQVAWLQDLLAVSHKYQLSRLCLWCQQQLCKRLTVKEVCSVLCQAHLCEATQLERACLKLLQQNLEELVETPEFVNLTAAWPQMLLKLTLCTAGISDSKAATCVEAHQTALRRRRHA